LKGYGQFCSLIQLCMIVYAIDTPIKALLYDSICYRYISINALLDDSVCYRYTNQSMHYCLCRRLWSSPWTLSDSCHWRFSRKGQVRVAFLVVRGLASSGCHEIWHVTFPCVVVEYISRLSCGACGRVQLVVTECYLQVVESTVYVSCVMELFVFISSLWGKDFFMTIVKTYTSTASSQTRVITVGDWKSVSKEILCWKSCLVQN
jgi:hypothetical protein